MMFGERCFAEPQCGHPTNWSCPCTCGQPSYYDRVTRAVPPAPALSEIERLQAQIEGMALYVQHDSGCPANDLDYLDKSPCTCGLHRFYNPKGAALSAAPAHPRPRMLAMEGNIVVPQGMTPWHGGSVAPKDWDGGPVLLRDGSWDDRLHLKGAHWWQHDAEDDDVIAYCSALNLNPRSIATPTDQVKDAKGGRA